MVSKLVMQKGKFDEALESLRKFVNEDITIQQMKSPKFLKLLQEASQSLGYILKLIKNKKRKAGVRK